MEKKHVLCSILIHLFIVPFMAEGLLYAGCLGHRVFIQRTEKKYGGRANFFLMKN